MNAHDQLAEAFLLRIQQSKADQAQSMQDKLEVAYKHLNTFSRAGGEGIPLSDYALTVFNSFRAKQEQMMRKRKGIPEDRAEDYPWRKNTHQSYVMAFNSALAHYHELGRIPETRIKPKWSRSHAAILRESAIAEKRIGVVFAEGEWELFIEECANRSPVYAVAMTIMLAFGLRASDLLDARLSNFQRISSRKKITTPGWYFVTSGKIGKRRERGFKRYIPDAQAKAFIAALNDVGIIDPEQYILPKHKANYTGWGTYEFVPEFGKPMKREVFADWFRSMCNRIGFELEHGVCTHSVRITRVTKLKEAGAHNEDVAKLTGMSPSNVHRYDKNEAHQIGHLIDTSLLIYAKDVV